MKIKGIKKTIGALNRYNHVKIYLNRKTGEVWANEYADGNSWTQYDDNAIINLHHFFQCYEEVNSMKSLKAICERVCSEYASGKADF